MISPRFASANPRPIKILDFDIECRPLSWYGGDWVTKEVTAIAAGWVGEGGRADGDVKVWLLDPWDYMARDAFDVTDRRSIADAFERGMTNSTVDMFSDFMELYDEADIVTGHYIRGFDLPVLNGLALEFGLEPLGDKLTHDTKGDLVKSQGISKSMENLGSTFELEHPKIIMNQAKWRSANRLLPDGLKLTRARVVGDVLEHIEMRHVMLQRGLLRPPSLWSGTGNGSTPQYAP